MVVTCGPLVPRQVGLVADVHLAAGAEEAGLVVLPLDVLLQQLPGRESGRAVLAGEEQEWWSAAMCRPRSRMETNL